MRSLFLLAAVALALCAPVLADDTTILDPYKNLFTSTTSISAGGIVSEVVNISKVKRMGANYSFTTAGTLNVRVDLAYENANVSTASTNWCTYHSIDTTARTTGWDIAINRKTVAIVPAEAAFVKITLTNNDAAAVTKNFFRLFKQ